MKNEKSNQDMISMHLYKTNCGLVRYRPLGGQKLSYDLANQSKLFNVLKRCIT